MLMTAAHASSPATAEVLISELKASQPEILQHIARSIPGTVPKHTDLICGARGREHPWQKWQTGHGDDEKDRQHRCCKGTNQSFRSPFRVSPCASICTGNIQAPAKKELAGLLALDFI